MSRYSPDPRSSGSHLAYGGGGGQRWDAERFAQAHARDQAERFRGPPVIERDRFEEHDRFETRGGGSWRRESSADEFRYRGAAPPVGRRFEEPPRFFGEERYGPPPRPSRPPPPRYYDEELDTMGNSPNMNQMVPFDRRRRQSITAERGYGPPARRNEPRPGIIRRQSSLDTFDRKPMVRYGDCIHEPPETIVIPAGSRRRRSPPRYVERDYEEEIRIAEPEYYGDEGFRGYREREVETFRRKNGGAEFEHRHKEEAEAVVAEQRPFPRRGKTKMPRRLVNKRAIIELGYPFEEEVHCVMVRSQMEGANVVQDETIIILKALGKEHIDEIVRMSREMKEEKTVTESKAPLKVMRYLTLLTSLVGRTKYLIEAPTPPQETEVVERRTTEVVISGPADEGSRAGRGRDDSSRSDKGGGGNSSKESHEQSRSRHEKRSLSPIEIIRKPSRSRHRSGSTAAHKEHEEESSSSHGALAIIAPRDHLPKDERTIQAEIRALEAEKRALKYEREMEKEHRKAERLRDGEIIIERDRDRDVIKIEKDRKGRMSIVR